MKRCRYEYVVMNRDFTNSNRTGCVQTIPAAKRLAKKLKRTLVLTPTGRGHTRYVKPSGKVVHF